MSERKGTELQQSMSIITKPKQIQDNLHVKVMKM